MFLVKIRVVVNTHDEIINVTVSTPCSTLHIMTMSLLLGKAETNENGWIQMLT